MAKKTRPTPKISKKKRFSSQKSSVAWWQKINMFWVRRKRRSQAKSLYTNKTTKVKKRKARKKDKKPFPYKTFFKIIAIFLASIFIAGLVYFRFFMFRTAKQSHSLQSCRLNSEISLEKDIYGAILINDQDNKIKKVYTIHYGPDANEVATLDSVTIDGETWIELNNSTKFQFTQLSNLYSAGKAESGQNPYCFITENLSSLTGTPLNVLVITQTQSAQPIISSLTKETSINNQFMNLVKNLVYRFPLSQVESNLTINDLINLLTRFSLAKKNDQTLPSNVLKPEILDNGQKIFYLDFATFNELYAANFKSQTIEDEQALIEVYNATDIAGLATLYSRTIQMVGGDVIRKGNAPYQEKTSQSDIEIYITEDIYPQTLKLLYNTFRGFNIETIYHRPEGFVTTGDIIIIIRKTGSEI